MSLSLRYVQIETTTTCNQRCDFCPVSGSRREKKVMSMRQFAKIVEGIKGYDIERVYLNGFNEPTYDKHLLDRVKILIQANISVEINSNGSGLTKDMIVGLLSYGVRNFTINISTVNKEQYKKTRKSDGLGEVMDNIYTLLTYARTYDAVVNILVLGGLDSIHALNVEEVDAVFTKINGAKVVLCPIANFSGNNFVSDANLNIYHDKVYGCASNRDNEWLHFVPSGKAILCCQDYDENYLVGDIDKQSPREIFEGSELFELRNEVNGDPHQRDDLICKRCVHAVGKESYSETMSRVFCNYCELPGILGVDNGCGRCVVNSYRIK